MMGTIERAKHQNNIKSIKIILEFVLEKYQSLNYRDQLMWDMTQLGEMNLNIFEFFGRSFQEKRSNLFETNQCKLEINLKSVEIPAFSDE